MQQAGGDRGRRHRDQHGGPERLRAPDARGDGDHPQAQAQGGRAGARPGMRQGGDLRDHRPGLGAGEPQAEQVLHLARQDGERDAGGEADRHCVRDVPDQPAEAQRAQQRQHQSGEDDGQHQAVDTEPGDGRADQHDEGAGRTADLEAAAAQGRHEESADDGGVEAAVGRDAGGDRDGHGERQGDDSDRQACDGVVPQVREAVALRQGGGELWPIELRRGGEGRFGHGSRSRELRQDVVTTSRFPPS